MEDDNQQQMVFEIKHDVFLSFRGEDTRANFTSHLHESLVQTGVETFIDYRLEKGDEISQALIEAIKASLVSLVIFSGNYANSKWCLDEICMIMERKRGHGQIVIPVFYEVDPSHVRNQTETYREAFAKHERDLISDQRLQKWRRALTEAANLAGWDFGTYRNESEFIKDIVKDVLQKLDIRCPIELKGIVGIEKNYAEVESLLEIGSRDEVRVIGIWGMGGIGKTTLARALYAKLFSQFEGHCFLASVREQSQKNGLVALRMRLFSELLGGKNLGVESDFATRRLKRKKVLIVLDDVATSEQSDGLISDYECLAPGSRVVVTTRDKHIFSMVNDIYKVKGLDTYHSLQLFCLNAFRDKRPKNEYEELSGRVIAYCKGNPLALKVLGALFQSRSKEAWESELRKLQKIPDMGIHNVLKLSFDGLDPYEKDIFLDIAFFFKGESRDYVTYLLDACGFYATFRIENLIDKSLMTISSDYNVIEMHDLIQETGWEIVHQESVKDPGRRSRLCDPKEVYDVLKNNKGTEVVEGIVLDVSKIDKDLHLSFNSFTKMTGIRILKFYSSNITWWTFSWVDERYKIYLPNGLESLSDELRHLEWHGYCLESLPSNFCAEKLVTLIMRCSNLKKLWDGVQNLEYLKEIDLSYSKDLVELPDLSLATNLQILRLDGCTSLRAVHPSILSLDKLLDLRLKGCTEIESLEMTEVPLKSLKTLNLSGCSSLKKLPSSVWRRENLVDLSVRGCCNLESLGIGSKSSQVPLVWTLDLCGCKLVNETNLCLILDGMRSLTLLMLTNCCNLRALPDTIGSLTSLVLLDLNGCINVEMLPPNMKNLSKLKELRLNNCRKLVSLPELPPSLVLLSAINCTSLQTDFTTQLLPVLTRDDVRWWGHRSYVLLPVAGGQVEVPEMFRFRGKRNSITVPPHSDRFMCRLICCLVLPHLPPDFDNGYAECRVNNEGYSTSTAIGTVACHTWDHHHLLLFSTDKNVILACDHPNTITFQFIYFTKGGLSRNKIKIKSCGFFPVFQQETIPTSVLVLRQLQQDVRERLSKKRKSCKRKSPSFNKEENSRPEKDEVTNIYGHYCSLLLRLLFI